MGIIIINVVRLEDIKNVIIICVVCVGLVVKSIWYFEKLFL